MIAIIDYKAGNLASVSNALTNLRADFTITSDTSILENSQGVIFPGVGHAAPAMESLKENHLDVWLKSTRKPVLGICLGMQLMFSQSEEGNTSCLGLVDGTLQKFDPRKDKVPHIGWNTVEPVRPHPLFENIPAGAYFYYVHSYFAPVVPSSIATCNYAGTPFSAAVAFGNFMGVQFHPEKSGETGKQLLLNFLDIVNRKQTIT